MKFSVGYQISENQYFIDEIINNKEHIYEVYFSWGDMANGRNNQLNNSMLLPWEAHQKQIADLKKLAEKGLSFNLLINGNCYGKDSQSRAFFNEIGNTVDYILSEFGLNSITTTSPLVAKFIKSNFEDIDVRASVNMKIGTVEGIEYLSGYFDSFYMQREFNRDFNRIKELKNWCDKHGKKMFMLANSGCLNNCSAQTFHDNLVSHETEISKMDNAYQFVGICRDFLKKEENYKYLIERTNFVRPEDMHLYDEYFVAAKLATRVSRSPASILKSYINQKYVGNILEILEPAHSIYPYVLENGNPLKIIKINTDIPMYQYEEDK